MILCIYENIQWRWALNDIPTPGLGDSAIVALGYAAGIDGTAGLQPRGTLVRGCMMSDVGVFGKQSACFSQAIAMQTRLEENICYNVPRSGFVRTRHGLHSQSSCHACTASDCACVSCLPLTLCHVRH